MKNAMQKCPKYSSTHSIEINGFDARFHAGFGKIRWKMAQIELQILTLHEFIESFQHRKFDQVSFFWLGAPLKWNIGRKKNENARKSIKMYQHDLN